MSCPGKARVLLRADTAEGVISVFGKLGAVNAPVGLLRTASVEQTKKYPRDDRGK